MATQLLRTYYKHEISLNNITEYIINNPRNWDNDEFFN